MIDLNQIQLPKELPISEREEEILQTIRKHQVVIIRGETGSGKTTQIPKICLKAGLGAHKVIACTQPRRVAAFAVGNRISEELGAPGKGIVGTKIRFSDHTTRQTRIKVMTDGILLNEMQRDPLLRQYSVIIVDEAHERSLNIDFILGHLIQIRSKRKDLKIIITSATIDTQLFSDAFGGAPVIEVTGRMFPVEVRYEPFEEDDRGGDITYIDASFEAVEQITATSKKGDVLVFLPAEKDIRELCDLLDGNLGARFEIVPLFGRLSQADQQKIFRTNQRRKIVVATNIAETSITVPGIRYVVDSGLARISRYSSHTRTQRLPIEPISQSSANQRKGRCGRIEDGICIRLYSEQDFESREEFTPPEIFRSNLASVILRLKAFKFGTVEDFPFIDRPDPRTFQGGMILLKELCAIDEEEHLTEMGYKLARLPIDPTVGRMLLEARKLNVLRSVLIIASALSIRDPRERPLDKEAKAEQEHQKFSKKDSDFLSLLQIWRHFDEKYEKWSQGKMRKFCRDHFISYQRLREWREIHQQIRRVLEDLKSYKEGVGEEDPDLIHQSILTGLIGNVAFWEDGNWYQATRGRKVMVFPGSVMFKKTEKKNRIKGKDKPNKSERTKKQWVMAAEFVETSRLFARTLAVVDSQWIRKAGAHLINNSYQEPHWSSKSQRVLCWKKEFLYGLQIDKIRAGYGKVDPHLSKEIFIRGGILEREIRDRFPFLEENQKLQDGIVELQTRFRRSLSYDLDYRLYQFYDKKLPLISSVAELHRWWRSLDDSAQKKLYLTEQDLLDATIEESEKEAFPEVVDLGGVESSIDYRYKPGESDDGATLKLPLSQFASVQEGSLDWMVPGYVEEKVEQLLRSLPKDYRRFLTPVRDKCSEIMLQMKPSPRTLIEDLSSVIQKLYGIKIPSKVWDLSVIPDHLRLKIDLVDEESGKVVIRSHNWQELHEQAEAVMLKKGVTYSEHTQVKIWKDACQKWERNDVKAWQFGDLPESIELGAIQGIPLMAFPGMVVNTRGEVGVRLFKHRKEALKFTPGGYRKLCEWAVGREVGWFIRDIKQLKSVYVSFSDSYLWDDFAKDVEQLVLGSLFRAPGDWPLKQNDFEKTIELSKQRLRGMRYELSDLLESIGNLRLEFLNGPMAKHPLTAQLLSRLLPARFMRVYNLQRIHRLPRYLEAHKLRLKRAVNYPQKDLEKSERMKPLLTAYVSLVKRIPTGDLRLNAKIRDLFFALEEYRISVFAQELGTEGKVSQKVLGKMIEEIEEALG